MGKCKKTSTASGGLVNFKYKKIVKKLDFSKDKVYYYCGIGIVCCALLYYKRGPQTCPQDI